MDIQSLRERREEILQIAAKHGARTIRVFGSVARGEEDETSDLDFLVGDGGRTEPSRSWRASYGTSRSSGMPRGCCN